MTILTRRTAVPPDDNPPALAKRTPALAYARCLDCGTEEGQPCYDSSDRPLASVCQGRTLSSRGSLDRETRNKYKKKVSASLKPPNQCGSCGLNVNAPRKWCWRKVCQDFALARWRAMAPPNKTPTHKMTCNNCRCTYETRNAAVANSKDPHCMKPECRKAYRQKIGQRHFKKKKATP